MRKPLIFAIRFLSGQFYFLPTILYSWSECNCWMFAFIWGNIGLEIETTCAPIFEGNNSDGP